MKLGPNMSWAKSDDPRLGRRVELPCWSDQWMQGARFGVVKRVILNPSASDILCVQCDNPRIRRQYRHFETGFKYL